MVIERFACATFVGSELAVLGLETGPFFSRAASSNVDCTIVCSPNTRVFHQRSTSAPNVSSAVKSAHHSCLLVLADPLFGLA